jgi:very-short-patch-repair endonuclease
VPRARQLRKRLTTAERKLWYGFLRSFRYRVLRQRRIDRYIVDFYCAKLKLVIEVDGGSHAGKEAQVYDAQRTLVLEGLGLRVVRFTNAEVMDHFEAVCEVIEGVEVDPPSVPP